jgi:hypothetical protein
MASFAVTYCCLEHDCHAALKRRKMRLGAQILHSNPGIRAAFVLKCRKAA